MDENHTMVAATSSAELLQAQADLWRHIFSYLKSMALSCAVKLGIPNAIHRCGGAASLPEIHTTIPVPANKQPYLPRLMRFLTALGIFAVDVPAAGEEAAGSAVIYRLTPVSRLLVDEAGADSCVSSSLSPFVLFQSMDFLVKGALRLGEWFGAEGEAPETPLKMEHGVDVWGILCHEPELNEIFNQGLGSDTRFVLHLAIRECGEVFEGISSLVDVGGGNGTAARAIAKAFPQVKCSVLDLPHVIGNIVPDGTVEFIVGDMMDFIPPADAVLLKYVLHDWTDEVCVKILTQCRKAIHSREAGGKVIIIDTVVGSPSGEMYEAQLLYDLLMMVVTAGKERDEHEWKKVFMDAGFSHYKVRPVLGFLSIIEVYP